MTQNLSSLAESQRLEMLAPPRRKPAPMVLDTDTYNEIDDQFALVYAMLSQEAIDLQAVYAAPFHNARSSGPADGMEKSYEEILRVFERLGADPEGVALRGSDAFLPAPDRAVESEAAHDLVRRAMDMPDGEPLYVAAVGAITNVASAILIEPRIADKIVVVWLGGNALWWHTAHEFNLKQDIPAARIVFDCGVALVHVSVIGVTSHLHTTLPEIEAHVAGRGAIGDYLAEIYRDYFADHFARSKVLWDMAAVAWLAKTDALETELVNSPILTDQVTYSVDRNRHFIRSVRMVHRDKIFGDFFRKLDANAASS